MVHIGRDRVVRVQDVSASLLEHRRDLGPKFLVNPVVDYSLRLRTELPGPPLWVAGYTNDVFGYVPSRRVLLEGGYEPVGSIRYYSTLPSPFAPSIEEVIVAKVHELVGRVRSEALAK